MKWSDLQFTLVCLVIIGLLVFWDRSKRLADTKQPLSVERMPNTLLDNLLSLGHEA